MLRQATQYSTQYSILYGDIHNHNAHGYGIGSIERSLEIARTRSAGFPGSPCEMCAPQLGQRLRPTPRNRLPR